MLTWVVQCTRVTAWLGANRNTEGNDNMLDRPLLNLTNTINKAQLDCRLIGISEGDLNNFKALEQKRYVSVIFDRKTDTAWGETVKLLGE